MSEQDKDPLPVVFHVLLLELLEHMSFDQTGHRQQQHLTSTSAAYFTVSVAVGVLFFFH